MLLKQKINRAENEQEKNVTRRERVKEAMRKNEREIPGVNVIAPLSLFINIAIVSEMKSLPFSPSFPHLNSFIRKHYEQKFLIERYEIVVAIMLSFVSIHMHRLPYVPCANICTKFKYSTLLEIQRKDFFDVRKEGNSE